MILRASFKCLTAFFCATLLASAAFAQTKPD